jgi:glycerol-3-phosphate acyltransferase PlsY
VGACSDAMTTIILAAVVGYLLGSIPFGLLLTRLAGHGDIRRIGSGSIGATNVLRTGSKGLAALTLAFDALKGAAAVLIGGAWSEEAALAGGAAVIVGHMYPVWLGFRGGKGVATALGVLLVIAWPVALGAALLWLATAAIFRYSSLAALVAAVATAALAGFVVDRPRAALIALIAILVVVRHRENVQRLLAGTESRISFGKG